MRRMVVVIFPLLFQSTEEESSSQRAPPAGHASEDQETWRRDVHGESGRKTSHLEKESDKMPERIKDRGMWLGLERR